MTDNNQLHVVFGTGPVGMAVMDELVSKGTRVRMVNRSGRANVPEGVPYTMSLINTVRKKEINDE